MKMAAELASKLRFDGVDINMGCPDRSVERQGAGAMLLKNVAQARELIRAAKEGAPNLPVSVKTRIGYNRPELESWLPEILEEEPAVVTIHARTRKEMSKVPAQWGHVKQAVEIRDKFALRRAQGENKCLIFGNGDVKDLSEAKLRVEETGCDGIMLGRAIFGNPRLFQCSAEHWNNQGERLKVLVEHTKLFEKLLGEYKNFAIMKKHFKAYVSGFDGAAELRAKLMEVETAEEVEEIVSEFIKTV
jgi:tRNA-dihydrouridine synthase